jgi:hypothetical protein
VEDIDKEADKPKAGGKARLAAKHGKHDEQGGDSTPTAEAKAAEKSKDATEQGSKAADKPTTPTSAPNTNTANNNSNKQQDKEKGGPWTTQGSKRPWSGASGSAPAASPTSPSAGATAAPAAAAASSEKPQRKSQDERRTDSNRGGDRGDRRGGGRGGNGGSGSGSGRGGRQEREKPNKDEASRSDGDWGRDKKDVKEKPAAKQPPKKVDAEPVQLAKANAFDALDNEESAEQDE